MACGPHLTLHKVRVSIRVRETNIPSFQNHETTLYACYAEWLINIHVFGMVETLYFHYDIDITFIPTSDVIFYIHTLFCAVGYLES